MKVFALLAATALFAAPASAESWNFSTNDFGHTTGYSSGGGSYSSTTNDFGYTTFYGTDSNGNSYSGSCSSNDFGYTSCSSW